MHSDDHNESSRLQVRKRPSDSLHSSERGLPNNAPHDDLDLNDHGNDASHQGERVSLTGGDRFLAAVAYIGVLPFLIIASRPGPTFIRRHQHRAATVHLVRIVWVGLVTGLYWMLGADGTSGERLQSFLYDFAFVVIVGMPWYSTWGTDALPWLLTPVILTWGLSIAGFILAATGKSADFQAFINADWSDPVRRRRFLYTPPDVERAQARRARERQLERLQKSSRTMLSERTRRDQISDLEEQIDRLGAQREYYDQLLALGEISKRRYEHANQELDEREASLRGELAGLTTRAATHPSSMPQSMRVNRLSRPSETMVESLAFVTASGVPIFVYGKYQMDEALVAGMLSAFDSLSEEVFGSRVHKTELSHGQVLYFSHGEHVVVMATFDDEPAPRQVEQLRTMVRQFEAANQGPLSRGQIDPAYLHEVEVPFRFQESTRHRTEAPPE